jgi:hypothetical protein
MKLVYICKTTNLLDLIIQIPFIFTLNKKIMKKSMIGLLFITIFAFFSHSQDKEWEFSGSEWDAYTHVEEHVVVDDLIVMGAIVSPLGIIPETKTFYNRDYGHHTFNRALKFYGTGVTGGGSEIPSTGAIAFNVDGPGVIGIICLSSDDNQKALQITNGSDFSTTIAVEANTFKDKDGNELPLTVLNYEGGPGMVYVYALSQAINLFYLAVGTIGDTIHAEPVTFNVQVPEGTKECWIAGSFNGWNSASHQMEKVDDFNYTLTVPDVDMNSLEYKYMSGPGWAYVEKDAIGEEVPNRIYQANDTVYNWLSIFDPTTVVNKPITFEVTVPNHVQSVYLAGDFNNWNMPDPNTRLLFQQMTSKGKVFGKTIMVNNLSTQTRYKFTAGPDWQFAQTQEDDFYFTDIEVDTIRHTVFGFYAYANSQVQPKDWNFSEMYANDDLVEFNSTIPDDGLLFIAGENENVMTVDKNETFNDQLQFTHRLKTNGSGVTSTENPRIPTARAVAFNVGGQCQIAVAALSASSSEDRQLIVSDPNQVIATIHAPGIYNGPDGNVPMNIINYDGPAGPVFIYSANSGINIYYVGVSSYAGIPLPETSVTYTVKVPEGTPQVCIAGDFNNWTPGVHWMNQLDSVTYTLTVDGATVDMKYKYLNGPDWSFEEVARTGSPVPNRSWSELDEVEAWANIFMHDETRFFFDDIHTSAGEDITIDIKTSSNQSRQAISYQFELHYDANTIEYTGYTTEGTVADLGEVVVNSTKDVGVLYISFMTSESFDIINSLIKLNFKVINLDSHNTTSPWFNECYIDDQQIYHQVSGTIYIDHFMLGDVDGNQRVQAYDAALTLQYSVGKDPLPLIAPRPWEGWRLQAADVDGVPGITANDAAMILQYSAYVITSFDTNGGENGMIKAPNQRLADVEILKDQHNLYFKAFGKLVGFNLFIEENLDAFGAPVITGEVMSAVNTEGDIYAVGLAAIEPLVDGVTFLTIPLLREIPADIQFRMYVNADEINRVAEAQTAVKSISEAGITLYPNPASNQLWLNNLAENSSIRIYDISGRVVLQKEAGSSSERLDISNLSDGIYSISILNKNTNAMSKFIKR